MSLLAQQMVVEEAYSQVWAVDYSTECIQVGKACEAGMALVCANRSMLKVTASPVSVN
jgi:hypothetical protein